MCHVIYGFESAKLKIIPNLFTWMVQQYEAKKRGKLKYNNKKWRFHRDETSTYIEKDSKKL